MVLPDKAREAREARVGYTRNFQLTTSSTPIPNADREKIDALLYHANNHRHSGSTVDLATQPAAPTLTVVVDAGQITSGQNVYYRIATVHSSGFESVASIEDYVATPAPVATPGKPSPALAGTTGTLAIGTHDYVVTAYTSTNRSETTASPIASLAIASTSTRNVTLTMPTLPNGATGFNAYVRRPGSTTFQYLASTTGATIADNGSATLVASRFPPTSNKTNGQNAITIAYPGGVVPVGYTWKIYRTFNPGVYTDSLLAHVTTDTGGVVTATYTDVGGPTLTGSPTSLAFSLANPPKVTLTDASDVQTGKAPLGVIAATPVVVTFQTEKPTVRQGATVYTVESPKFKVIGVRATTKVATNGTLRVNVVRISSGSSIFSGTFPEITNGNRVGTRVAPATVDFFAGDRFRVDITLSDTASTGLTVTIYGMAIFDSLDSDSFAT